MNSNINPNQPNNTGNNNANPNNNNNNRPLGNRTFQPQQIAQLAQHFKNEVALAKAAGSDTKKAQQHYAKANSIKQILMTYQAQQRALKNAAGGQQQPQQQPSQQSPAPSQQQLQQISQQSPTLQNPSLNTPAAHALGSPAIGQTPAPSNRSQQSPLLSNVSTPSIQSSQSQPSQGSSGQNQGPATGGANNNISIETYNQVKARLADFQKKIQQLENSKQTYPLTPEQLSSVDSQVNLLRTKYTKYDRYAQYVRSQLLEQARANNSNTGAPGTAGSVGSAGSPQINSMSSPAPNQFQRTNAPQQSPLDGTGIAATPNRGVPQQPQPVQQAPLAQQQSQQAQGIQNPGARPIPASRTSQFSQSAQGAQGNGANQPAAVATPSAAIANNATPGSGAKPRLPNVGPNPVPKPQPGRSVSPPGAANASAAGTPNKASSPSASSSATGPPPINLSGITKPSVPSIPISSTINVKPPTAVTLKPNANNNRASLMGGAANGIGQILGTPAILKMPTYELAAGVGGESIPDNGGRVLTKRKLTELVNTIGADEGDGKTNIDGDVEELLLDLADEFITSVTGFACRLAKHRKVESVDVRDVQLHLERNWNIRIPGYAMDEIKSTRKWQPSSSYSQKVSGVDISKSVNGNIN